MKSNKNILIKQTFKARELPKSLQEALHSTPEAEIVIHAELVGIDQRLSQGKDHWKKALEEARKQAPLKGNSEKFNKQCK